MGGAPARPKFTPERREAITEVLVPEMGRLRELTGRPFEHLPGAPSRAATSDRRMSRSSAPTWLPSALNRRLEVVSPARRQDRLSALLILALLVAWFAYTRLYFWLQPRGLTFAPSLFMKLTGRPDPTCGLTRTFAWIWRGDLGHAVVVYPLGPLVFLAALALLAYSAAGFRLFCGRFPKRLREPLSRPCP